MHNQKNNGREATIKSEHELYANNGFLMKISFEREFKDDLICTSIPSRSASHWSSQTNGCEERGHLWSENSCFSASLILKGESGQKKRAIQSSGGDYHSLSVFTCSCTVVNGFFNPTWKHQQGTHFSSLPLLKIRRRSCIQKMGEYTREEPEAKVS